jgi:1-acyl-sn-glycerol-3-phosphate acyltransferase
MKLRRNNRLYEIIQKIGSVFLQMLYRIQIEGRENIPSAGPGIILPKHQYWTDIPIVALAVWKPLSYIAKQELFVIPGIRHLMTWMGGIPLDRKNPLKSLDSFRYFESLLPNKDFVVIFPEGTYYRHSMGKGKFRLIERILKIQGKTGVNSEKGIPFIPMGIRYEKKIFRPQVQVKIGHPIYASGETDGRKFTRRILKEIAMLSGFAVPGEEEDDPKTN